MAIDHTHYWQVVEDEYKVILHKAIARLRSFGVYADDEAADYVHQAIVHYGERAYQYQWETKEKLVNVVVLKAVRLRLDDIRKLAREEEIRPVFDQDGNEMAFDDVLHRLVEMEGIPDARAEYDGDDPLDECDKRLTVNAALNLMSQPQRHVWKLLLDGFYPDEIAELMGVTRDAVYKNAKRGILAAKKVLVK